jgi:hypothetical protein
VNARQGMDESRPRVRNDVTVWLTCHCRLRVRNTPINTKTTYPCPSNRGHGYNRGWTRWETDDGRAGFNKTTRGEETK